MCIFEFDEAKSLSNLAKHGIDFHRAQEMWADELLIESPAKKDKEDRLLVIGQIDNKFWSAVIIYRDDVIRLISVRRSRRKEIELYERERLS